MKQGIITKEDLKQKSRELAIPFSNLLAGYMLEELMRRISESEFAEYLWLKNDGMFGAEQYRRKNILTLEFVYRTNERVIEKGTLAAGQKLSLKLSYMMLLQLLQEGQASDTAWLGKAVLTQEGAELELTGELAHMKVPIFIKLTESTEEEIGLPKEKTLIPVMGQKREIPYLCAPAEYVLAEFLYRILRDMELISDMEPYAQAYGILSQEPLSGRRVREALAGLCRRGGLKQRKERAEELFSYRDYTYMRKRWEKYVRHHPIFLEADGDADAQEAVSWEAVMDRLEPFLSEIWRAVCRDEVFFGDWMPDLKRFLD